MLSVNGVASISFYKCQAAGSLLAAFVLFNL